MVFDMTPAETGPRLDHTAWWRPREIVRDPSYLRWITPEEVGLGDDSTDLDVTHASTSPDLLERFVRLKDDLDGIEIERFASKWGVLELCHHQLPKLHEQLPSMLLERVLSSDPQEGDALDDAGSLVPARGPLRVAPCAPQGKSGWVHEPLAAWRRAAEVFGLIARAGDAWREGRAQDRAVWRALHPDLEGTPDPGAYRDAFPPVKFLGRPRKLARNVLPDAADQADQRVRGVLALLVNDLIALGGVGLQLDWTGPRPDVRVGVDRLLGALSLQLAFGIGGVRGFAVCSECGAVYEPARQPVHGQRRYCSECKARNVPQRDATRDARRRKREAASRK
jgi:hypothetical protein